MIGRFEVVRGIGSLHGPMIAIQHALPDPLALQLIKIMPIVAALSTRTHVINVTPLMAAAWRCARTHP